MPIEIASFNHTNLTVRDLDRIVAFFVDGCGFELLSRGPRDGKLVGRMTALGEVDIEIAYVQGPGHRIELITYRHPEPTVVAARFCDAGAHHVAFDVRDMEGAIATAGDFGFKLVGDVIAIDGGPNVGRKVAYVRDVDGLVIEFLELAKG